MDSKKKWLSITIITLAIACILCASFGLFSGPELVVPGATTKKSLTRISWGLRPKHPTRTPTPAVEEL